MIFNFQFKRECRHSQPRKGSSRIKKNLNQKQNNNLPCGAHAPGCTLPRTPDADLEPPHIEVRSCNELDLAVVPRTVSWVD